MPSVSIRPVPAIDPLLIAPGGTALGWDFADRPRAAIFQGGRSLIGALACPRGGGNDTNDRCKISTIGVIPRLSSAPMWIHRLSGLAIITVLSVVLRVNVVPEIDRALAASPLGQALTANALFKPIAWPQHCPADDLLQQLEQARPS